jgi:hypothetical protein
MTKVEIKFPHLPDMNKKWAESIHKLKSTPYFKKEEMTFAQCS